MAADTEIIAGYEVYTPEAAAELPDVSVQTGLPHPLGELLNIVWDIHSATANTPRLRPTHGQGDHPSRGDHSVQLQKHSAEVQRHNT
jgi:hypothetical protein